MHIIGPLVVIALIGLVILIVVTARRQRSGLNELFVEAARLANLTYQEQDDGTAEAMATGFDESEFNRFNSPSIGRVPPKNVVHGKVAEGRICLFSHYTHHTEGDARQWFVAIVETSETLSSRDIVKCRSREVRRVTEIGGIPEVDMQDDPDFNRAFGTQADDKTSARRCLTGPARRAILGATLPLGYPVDLQISASRIALYPAGRNYSPTSAQDLVDLITAARQVSSALAQ